MIEKRPCQKQHTIEQKRLIYCLETRWKSSHAEFVQALGSPIHLASFIEKMPWLRKQSTKLRKRSGTHALKGKRVCVATCCDIAHFRRGQIQSRGQLDKARTEHHTHTHTTLCARVCTCACACAGARAHADVRVHVRERSKSGMLLCGFGACVLGEAGSIGKRANSAQRPS